MSTGSFGADPGQSGTGQAGPHTESGWTPAPPQYPQPGMYGYPVSPQFQLDYATPPPPVPMPRGTTNSLAVGALCCGLGQLLVGPLTGIPAIILGAMSLKQIRETGERGHGMAVAGLVLGVVGTLLTMLVVVLVVAVVGMVSHSGTPPAGP